ncbi:MAG: histidine kinase [Chromatiales bacterium]|jgi:small ligand-binding sensory domain FIST|nr:histidine kinase [Chromatiales bacterium]
MYPFSSAQANGEDWRACVDQCVAQLQPVADASLGFVYWTDTLHADVPEMLQLLRKSTGIEHWVGTVALGVCGQGAVNFDNAALSVMVGAFPKDSFKVFAPLGAGEQLAEADEAWLEAQSSHLALVHADQHAASLDAVLQQLTDAMGGGFLLGGIGSARASCPQVADAVVSGGLSGVMFADEVAVSTRLSQGCTPIGPTRTVTKGDSNVILELDDRAALDVFKEDIGEVLARDLSRVGGYIFAGFAVAGSDTEEYLVRNLVGIDPNKGALAVGEHVRPGDRLMFCRRDPQTAIDDMERMLGELAESLGGRQPKGGIYVSCLARGPNQFSPPELEMTLIQKHFGELPVTGFFANGEISHDRLYAYTGVLTLFL